MTTSPNPLTHPLTKGVQGAVRPGVRFPRQLRRHSRLLFHFRAADLLLDWDPWKRTGRSVTDELATFTRTTAGGYTRGHFGGAHQWAQGIPRIEMSDLDSDGVFETPALLMEESRTNVLLRSEEIDNAAWADLLTPVVTANDIEAPDGLVTAERIEDNDGAGAEARQQDITIADDSTTWAACVYVKKAPAAAPVIILRVELLVGTTPKDAILAVDPIDGTNIASADVAQSGVIDSGDYWRVWLTVANNTSGNVTLRCGLYPAGRLTGDIGSAAIDTTATGFNHFWGGQVENADFPSSYVKTVASSVLRDRDNLTYPFLWTPGKNKTVYVKTTRPLFFDFAPTGVKPLFHIGTSGNASARIEYQAGTTIAVSMTDDAAAAASATRPKPTTDPIEYCAQYADLDFAAKVRLDVGSGFSAYSATVGKATAWGDQVLEIASVGLSTLLAGVVELKVADGLFTLKDMKEMA